MRVRVLSSAPAEAPDHQFLTSYLVEETVAIDAGCLGLHSVSQETAGLRHVFLTHAHLDHVCTLPIFLENHRERGDGLVRVYGPSAALDTFRENFLNDLVWVDYSRLWEERSAWVELLPAEPERALAVDGLNITPVPVHHSVPTFGYIIDDGSCAVVFGGDSGPTERIWEMARATGRLRAAFLECSFPDSLEALAIKTGHLTPRFWVAELRKLPPEAVVIAVHIKPRHRERVITELRALGYGRVQIGEVGREYSL